MPKPIRDAEPAPLPNADEEADTVEAPGAMQVRQRAVKAAVFETALQLFEANGYEAVTVSEIALQSRIGRRTFFLYFRSKEDLLIKWLDDEWKLATDLLLTKHASKRPIDAFASALVDIGVHLDSISQRARAIARIAMSNAGVFSRGYINQQRWERSWSTRLRQLHKQPTSSALTYEVSAATAFSAFVVAAQHWVDDPDQRTFSHWLKQSFGEIVEAPTSD